MSLESLKYQAEYDAVFQGGKKLNGKYFTFIFRPADKSRVGIIVSKKFGGAVKRNRIKRQIRVIFNSLAGHMNKTVEAVFLPRLNADSAEFNKLDEDIKMIAAKAGII